ncbi:hypothetical protein [Oceaniovalibus guishaninsula]|uniref:hypothetical protein n=1 Tax=Oceaniovalibus guishaninsula TaxID=1046117 RepID=UPI00058CA2E8|nr:hypothetical protein [Oceaniovalibus guishaninsula]
MIEQTVNVTKAWPRFFLTVALGVIVFSTSDYHKIIVAPLDEMATEIGTGETFAVMTFLITSVVFLAVAFAVGLLVTSFVSCVISLSLRGGGGETAAISKVDGVGREYLILRFQDAKFGVEAYYSIITAIALRSLLALQQKDGQLASDAKLPSACAILIAAIIGVPTIMYLRLVWGEMRKL